MAEIPSSSSGPDDPMTDLSQQTLRPTQPHREAVLGAGTKRGRSGSPDNTAGASPAKKSRPDRSNKHKKPKRPSDWHLSKGEIPNEAKETKVLCTNFYL